MCGIAGIFDFKKKIDVVKAKIAMGILGHRGPDDNGIFVNSAGNLVLLHTRLAIIDLSSAGHQPMSSEDSKIWITYNGEIYNFPDLKRELQDEGYFFRSHSDTEVILKAYQRWGEASFKKLEGMFAFCIYDEAKCRLYLVRDHAGIKPVYYSCKNSKFTFSSEVKTFNFFDCDYQIDADWKVYFLLFGFIPEPCTTLKYVYMLPKGVFLRLDLKSNQHIVEKYMEIKFSDSKMNQADVAPIIRERFTNAVKDHLISDTPIGVFLSGGIDSTLITLLAHKFEQKNLRTLSVIFNEPGFSEESYQNIVLSRINANHQAYLVTERDFIDNLENIFSVMDQPTIDGINTYLIAKCAHDKGLKAVLSGLGGDELFGGYPSFQRITPIMNLYRTIFRLKGVAKLFNYSPDERLKRIAFLAIPDPIGIYLVLRGNYSIDWVARILGLSAHKVYELLEKFFIGNAVFSLPDGNIASYLETNVYMQNQLLKDADFMSMANSVELRVPFLDRRFMELMFSIPEKIKFNHKIPKWLLTNVFSDLLPKEIVNRKKQGFTFPFQSWMWNNSDMIVETSGAIRNAATQKIVAEFQNNHLHWSRFWSLLVLSRFK